MDGDERLLAAKVKRVMDTECNAMLSSGAAATIVFGFLWDSVPTLYLCLWYGWILVFTGFCVIQMRRALINPGIFRNATNNAYFLLAINSLFGISWGALAWVAMSDELSLFISMVVISCLVGMLVGATTALTPLLPAFALACLSITAVTSSKLLLLPDVDLNNIGLFGMGICVALVLAGKNLHDQFNYNVQLEFDNLDLIEKLNQETEKVRAAQQLAENESQAKTKFLAAASHDIRQPIHALGLFLEVLARSSLTEFQKQALQNANTAFEASAEMLNTLLDFSRVEAGVVDVQQRAIYLQPILNKLESEMAPLAANKNLVYRSNDTEAIVVSDPALLELILRNLISNAIRYTEKGGIFIACRKRGNSTSLEIWDTGIGIDPAHHDNIFKEFYQLGNSERDRKKGLGLGLAIVRGYTQKLQHKLICNSVPGRGSVFKLELVNAIVQPQRDSVITKQLHIAELNANVLVIDDDETVRIGMVSLLQTWGCKVVAADSIDEALQLIKTQQPDLIVSDFRLRDLQTGAQAIAKVRAACSANIPALLITGDTAKDRLIEANQSGIPLLSKPVAPSLLYEKLQEILS